MLPKLVVSHDGSNAPHLAESISSPLTLTTIISTSPPISMTVIAAAIVTDSLIPQAAINPSDKTTKKMMASRSRSINS